MKRQPNLLGLTASVLLLNLAAGICAADPDHLEFFEKRVRPVLVAHCQECHGAEKSKGGLRLDVRAGWETGGDTGPAIVPGNPDESLLIQAIRYGGDYEMPPRGKLPDAVIRDLEEWVRMGAPDPRTDSVVAKGTTGIDLEGGKRHWAYQPVSNPALPSVRNELWPRGAVDRFILSQLEVAGLPPAEDAARLALIRRLYFDLHGLPPTVDEMDAFLNDDDPAAYSRLVDRLLASPRFGERWGRHWLDVARYAESMTLRGFVFKEAWRYRDYVIACWNEDRPYDDFVREQIAGDLLPAADPRDRERKLVATSFLALGNTNLEEQDKKQLDMDVIDEQLDVISKGFLAQTVTCARCHDHKFDPIPQRDYYALAGILKNTKALDHANVSKWVETPLPVGPAEEKRIQEHEALVASLQEQLQAAKQAVKKAARQAGQKVESALAIAASELPGVVVDDEQAKKVGEWKHSQFTKRYVGSGYVHDMREGRGEKTLTFVPELPRDGQYEVRFAYSPEGSRATAVPITIFSADGEKIVHVDETEPPPIDGRFVSLGQYRFEKAGQSFVIVSNEGTNGYVTADAVQFLPTDATSPAVAESAAEKEKRAASQAQLTAAEKELKQLEAAMKKTVAEAPYRPMAMTVLERDEITDANLLVRGVVHNVGEVVPRGFLQVCCTEPVAPLPTDQSGRRELAEWLASDDHPLTARVIVNRVWAALFGDGLVRTVDNFGLTGESPSHPELLDHLAARLVEREWSLKDLVRTLVLSRAYCQGGLAGSLVAHGSDPENRLVAFRAPRRLDAESLRDAMLLVSGELRWDVGGPGFDLTLASDYAFPQQGTRRSVYEPVFRNSLPEIFEAFDFADPSLVTGKRSTSTVAPQALYLLNHPFVLQRSQSAARAIVQQSPFAEVERVELLFRMALGRSPQPAEIQAALTFLAEQGRGGGQARELHAWSQLVQSLFATIDFRYVE